MYDNKTYNKRKVLVVTGIILLLASGLCGRLGYLMIAQAKHYQNEALSLHQRERSIKAARGIIYDRNGVALASNKPVCTISVIHSQVKEPDKVIAMLTSELEMDEAKVKKSVEKVSSREKIKSNVEKEVADRIRAYKLSGVMVDEDYKRYYPYNELASRVLGFTGGDNQGIVGLEVQYDTYLQGTPGQILTLTDARGVEIKNAGESRVEPIAGQNLVTSLDMNIQKYAQQAATKVMKAKSANHVSIFMMNPTNGEILAMVNVPEFNLNEPFTLNYDVDTSGMNTKQKQDLLNQMWRNYCVNDTYEPGSTFKIVTATAGLEEKVVSLTDTFSCPGFRIVEDRRIRCHKAGGHGQENFKQGFMNSCNPVFMDVGARVGSQAMYKNYRKLGLFEKTGIDVPGEANSIMHKIDDIKSVELATMSFGQSFQITPLQLLRAASAVINGGNLVTPHFGVRTENAQGKTIKTFEYPEKKGVIEKETSDTMKELLEAVVAEGSGKNAKIDGFRIGGKTATSEKLPRRTGKYISSFVGFAPANNPQVLAIILIDEPVGTYYGGTIAAPVMKELFENVLPYLGVKQEFTAVEEKNLN